MACRAGDIGLYVIFRPLESVAYSEVCDWGSFCGLPIDNLHASLCGGSLDGSLSTDRLVGKSAFIPNV